MSRLRRTAATVTTTAATAAVLATVLAVPATATVGNVKVPSGTDPCCTFTMRPGDTITSDRPNTEPSGVGLRTVPLTSSPYFLTVQSDGNVVEYDLGGGRGPRPVWSTGTAGIPTPARLTFQTDGNVVLYDAANAARWQSGTAGTAAAFFDVYGNGQVVTQAADGRVLAAVGPAVTALPGFVVDDSTAGTSSASYTLDVQGDGNVVAYRNDFATGRRVAFWSTGTAGAGQVRFVAQADGNLVVYRAGDGRAIWQAGSRDASGYHQLDVQADGNVVLYRTDGTTRTAAVWASGTRA